MNIPRGVVEWMFSGLLAVEKNPIDELDQKQREERVEHALYVYRCWATGNTNNPEYKELMTDKRRKELRL